MIIKKMKDMMMIYDGDDDNDVVVVVDDDDDDDDDEVDATLNTVAVQTVVDQVKNFTTEGPVRYFQAFPTWYPVPKCWTLCDTICAHVVRDQACRIQILKGSNGRT